MKKILFLILLCIIAIEHAYALTVPKTGVLGTTIIDACVSPEKAGTIEIKVNEVKAADLEIKWFQVKSYTWQWYGYRYKEITTCDTVMACTSDVDYKVSGVGWRGYEGPEYGVSVKSGSTGYLFDRLTKNGVSVNGSSDSGTNKVGTVTQTRFNYIAYFKPIVSIDNPDKWVSTTDPVPLVNNENKIAEDNSITIHLFNAKSLKTQGVVYQGGWVNSSNENIKYKLDKKSDSSTELPATIATGQYTLTIQAKNAERDETGTIRIDASNEEGGYVEIDVFVDDGGQVQFIHNPQVTYNVFDGNNVKYPISKTELGPTTYDFYNGVKRLVSLKLDPETYDASNYIVARWIIENNNRTRPITYRYEQQLTEFPLKKGDKISVEIVRKDYARYSVICGGDSVFYYNLQEAINVAQTSDNNVVYVSRSGKVPYREGGYTILDGVTLLVSGEGQNGKVVRIGGLEVGDFTNGDTGSNTARDKFKAGQYLELEDATNIKVNGGGNLCVHSELCIGQHFIGLPYRPGIIKMGDNCNINIESGANLMAYGFIAAKGHNASTSKVIAKAGANVYEILQIRDWPGGSNALGMVGAQEKVFPFSQYYIQNIETTLRIEQGATEYLSGCISMTGSGGGIILTQKFISEDAGFLQMTENAVVEKYYDWDNDRLQLGLYSSDNTNAAKAKLGEIHVQCKFEVIGIERTIDLYSSSYILPINMNTSISLNKAHVTNMYPVAMLAGSTLSLDDESILTLDGDLYVYDYNQHPQASVGWQTEYADVLKNNWGFYRSSSAPVNKETPVLVRSDGQTATSIDVSSDATIDNNGLIVTTSTGTLYTTGKATPENTLDPTGAVDITAGGANITSSLGGGRISFENTIFSSLTDKTYQRRHKGKSNFNDGFYSIPVTSAKLRNGNGTYESTINEKTIFTYSLSDPNDPQTGKWKKPDNLTYTNTNPADPISFVFNVPNVSTPETKPATVTVNFTGSSEDVTFSFDEKTKDGITIGEWNYIIADDKKSSRLEIPVSYTQTNVDGDHEASFTITTNKQGLTIPSFTVKASENYAPEFSCSVNGSLDIAGFCNTKTKDANLVITPGNEGDNVTALLNTNSNLVWSYDIINDAEDNFDFTFGDAADLSKAVVTFKPTTSGTKTATLQITATSKFVATGQTALQKTVEVPLSATATLCSQPIKLHDIKQLFVGEENIALIADAGNGSNIYIDYDNEYIELSPTSGSSTAYTIKAKKAGTITIKATQAEYNGYASSEVEIEITILDAVTWKWDILYYGATHTDPLIVDTRFGDNWSLTLEDNRQAIVSAFSADQANHTYTMALPLNKVEGEQQVKFMFRSGDFELPLFAELSDLRILTSCVENKKAFDALILGELDHVEYSDGAILFKSTESNISTWTAQFYGTPSTVEFTPYGTNIIWRVEQAATPGAFTAIDQMNGVYLTAGEKVTLPLNTNTRYLRFTYGASDNLTPGRLEDVCINRLDISATPNVVYLPIGETREVVVRHTCAGITTSISPTTGLTCTPSTPVNRTDFNETTLTLSATAEGKYTVTATENITEGKSVAIQVIVYKFPMGLPIIIDDWTQANGKEDYYNFYVLPSASANVRWDKNTKSIVFGYTAVESNRRTVVFAFEGSPSVLKFNYEGDEAIVPDDWTVEESTDGITYQPAEGSIQIDNKDFDFVQKLKYTTRYVRLSQEGAKLEKKLSNLIIEGYPSVILDPTELLLSEQTKSKTFTLTAINLQNIKLQVNNPAFTLQYQYKQDGQNVWSSATTNPIELKASNNTHPDALGINKVGDIVVKVTWAATASVSQGIVTVSNLDGGATLGTVKLVGAKEYIEADNTNTGIWTGVPVDSDGNPKYDLRGGSLFKPYTYHEVDVKNAFAGGKALFDYLVIYGETTTSDGAPIIYEADRSRGSNALTPYYIYKKEEIDTNDDGVIDVSRYKYVELVENANSGVKGWTQEGDDAVLVPKNGSLSMYITGFCPYATTGCTKDDEGVWYFRGPAGSRIDVYLEDCHLYSRNKSSSGQKYGKDNDDAPDFTEGVVQGSGAVLVFEHMIEDMNNIESGKFNVAIHTIGNNLLKSNYGAYFNLLGTNQGRVLAAQVSASVQVRLGAREHFEVAKTEIDFDDNWPTAPTKENGVFTATKRTNGFLSLQKQANHAPSIDLGNANTVVNFRGGQVELQNAEIVSPNYKTTLAISHRTGIMGNIKDFPLAYGIGTDDVGGTVNFYDGTTTVIPMEIDPAYRDFYLMDEDNPTRTSCLRTPTNTFIYGGSHCMLRACKYVTSRGGAPLDAKNGKPVGLYKYPKIKPQNARGGFGEPNSVGLVTPTNVPDDYNVESVTPENNGTPKDSSDDYLNFWFTEEEEPLVTPEEDAKLRTWLACMTEIQGGLMGVNARVGGDEYVGEDDEIHNLLYCQLDDYIYDVISATNGLTPSGDPNYTYYAPAIDPTSSKENPEYQDVPLTSVSDYKQHNIISENDYEVTKKVYYVTTAKTDTWMNFTMPFDVEKIWMLEPFSEAEIQAQFDKFKADDETLAKEGKLDKTSPNYLSPMERTLMWQAKYNADFAAFFGMAMAIGQYGKDFNDIYADYYTWAKNHADAGKYTGTYNLRGLYELKHYNGSNFTSSHYFLYKNMGDWTLDEDKNVAAARWEVAPAVGADSILMNKGETYSMLFPYCTGCDVQYKQNESTGEWELDVDKFGIPIKVERDYWDYWSGKILIFESTNGDPNPNTKDDDNPHVVRGSNYIAASKVDANTPWIFDGISPTSGIGVLTGNSTFSTMSVDDYEDIRDVMFMYNNDNESFEPLEPNEWTNQYNKSIVPTESFLVANYHTPIRLITRNGRVVTEDSEDQGNDNSGTTTGGHMPTVGGGHDLFITGTDGGINVAVANPQQVFVISATGTILYSGYVQDNVDIPLPINGIYVVKGETEVQKIFY